MTGAETYVDEWLADGEEVNSVAAGMAHHHATGHAGGGFGESYDCGECDFWICDGVVRCGGLVRFRHVPAD